MTPGKNTIIDMIEYRDGNKAWYRNGVLYRDDGPALDLPHARKFWYRDGRELTAQEGQSLVPTIESSPGGRVLRDCKHCAVESLLHDTTSELGSTGAAD